MNDYEKLSSKEYACLCMPYLLPIDGHDARKMALQDGSIEMCLKFFADRGYIHKEARWHHLGLFRSSSPQAATKVYLNDLGESSIHARKDQESAVDWIALTTKWIQESLQHLSNAAEDADAEDGCE